MLASTIIAIGAAHATYLSLLVISKPKRTGPDRILTAYLLVLAAAFASAFVAFA